MYLKLFFINEGEKYVFLQSYLKVESYTLYFMKVFYLLATFR